MQRAGQLGSGQVLDAASVLRNEHPLAVAKVTNAADFHLVRGGRRPPTEFERPKMVGSFRQHLFVEQGRGIRHTSLPTCGGRQVADRLGNYIVDGSGNHGVHARLRLAGQRHD